METVTLPVGEGSEKPSTKRNWWMILFFTSLIFVGAGATTSYIFYRGNLELKGEVEEHKQLNYAYTLQKERRRCITKTIMLAYGISQWEAFHYAIFFDQWSVYYQIPWEVYIALIRVETNFNTTLTSKKGCKGVMQIKGSTAEGECRKLGIRYREKNESKILFNEFLNLTIGSFYLSENILRKKDINKGVRCYLGGPDYLKSVKSNAETFRYVHEYKTKVSKEYEQLAYMFRGIVDEYSPVGYSEIFNSVKVDTISLIFDLFASLDTSVTKNHTMKKARTCIAHTADIK